VNKKYHDNDTAAVAYIIRNYQAGARKRNIAWELSLEDCKNIFECPCFYCGSGPNNVYYRPVIGKRKTPIGPYRYNGIDRVDNNAGYINGNVLPCCRMCNFAKRTMSMREFIDWIKRVHTKISRCATALVLMAEDDDHSACSIV